MKICPNCQTKYDEEIIRFCTKDGSPLVEENPSFTAMPSQSSIDDIGEETLITRNRPTIPPPAPVVEEFEEPAQRVVIPIGEEKKQAVKTLENSQNQYQQPRKSNTALVVFLTIFGTFTILAGGIGVWWFLSSGSSGASNSNSNSNVNVINTNSEVNYNSTFPTPDFNTNINTTANTNVNANTNTISNTNASLKTPTPTKTPTPKPSPTVSPNANVNINGNTIINISPANSNTSTNVKTVTPTPTATPKPSPVNTTPSNVNVGVMNSRARELRKPAYPANAKQVGASGQVVVQISIDEGGNVIGAKAVSGHPLLRLPAEAAARQSSFNPVKVGDKMVKASGTIVYNFINQ